MVIRGLLRGKVCRCEPGFTSKKCFLYTFPGLHFQIHHFEKGFYLFFRVHIFHTSKKLYTNFPWVHFIFIFFFAKVFELHFGLHFVHVSARSLIHVYRSKGRVFLVPVSPPVHFEWSKIVFFLYWRYLNRTFLSGQFCEQHGRTAKHVHSYGALERCVCFYVLCASIHQHIEPTVVCSEFLTRIVVLLFMHKGSHFVGIHTAYRERQRNLTAHHYRIFRFFSDRPPFHFGDHELTETKRKKGFSKHSEACISARQYAKLYFTSLWAP